MKASKGKELLYLLAIPVGVFLFCVFFEIGNDFYWQKKLDKSTSNALKEALEVESIDTREEYVEYINKKLTEDGFENIKINLTTLLVDDDGNESVVTDSDLVLTSDYKIQVSCQIEHFSVTGYIKSTTKFSTSTYIGYIDEYNEAVVEEVNDEDLEDDRVYTDEEERNLTSTTTVAVA